MSVIYIGIDSLPYSAMVETIPLRNMHLLPMLLPFKASYMCIMKTTTSVISTIMHCNNCTYVILRKITK